MKHFLVILATILMSFETAYAIEINDVVHMDSLSKEAVVEKATYQLDTGTSTLVIVDGNRTVRAYFGDNGKLESVGVDKKNYLGAGYAEKERIPSAIKTDLEQLWKTEIASKPKQRIGKLYSARLGSVLGTDKTKNGNPVLWFAWDRHDSDSKSMIEFDRAGKPLFYKTFRNSKDKDTVVPVVNDLSQLNRSARSILRTVFNEHFRAEAIPVSTVHNRQTTTSTSREDLLLGHR